MTRVSHLFRWGIICIALFLCVQLLHLAVNAQSPHPTQTPDPVPTPTPSNNFAKEILRDQKVIWTSPFRIKRKDLKPLLPLAAITVSLIATDRHLSSWVKNDGSLPAASRNTSRLVWGAYGVPVGLFLIGKASGNKYAAKTGRLAFQALVNTEIVTFALKESFRRERPERNSGKGRFFRNGNSFPSGHSSSAFAVATVISYRYKNNPWIKYGSFALATVVALSRFSGRKHFASDLLIGSAIGYGIGRFVYKEH